MVLAVIDRSPAEDLFHFVHIRQIIKEKVRLVFRQLLPRPGAGRDRDGARAECFPAGNVVAGIADHVDLCRRKIDSGLLPRTRESKSAKLITIVVIIGERAKRKEPPQIVVLEL